MESNAVVVLQILRCNQGDEMDELTKKYERVNAIETIIKKYKEYELEALIRRIRFMLEKGE